ncbi:hypothetical protein TNCV_2965661 [Trichonephila clavipes]|nr:hypothetical protein TNCV_2965661 [Trichonephila clavipes]
MNEGGKGFVNVEDNSRNFNIGRKHKDQFDEDLKRLKKIGGEDEVFSEKEFTEAFKKINNCILKKINIFKNVGVFPLHFTHYSVKNVARRLQ